MFCNQCQQTAKGTGCTTVGVCGKNEDIQSLQETLLYGLKGISAYAYHARHLGKTDPEIDAFLEEGLFKTLTNTDFSLEDHIAMVLKAGEINLKAMALLDEGNTERYGNPVPTEVPVGTIAAPGILITGHDLVDLEALLKQTEGTGIQIYTHGEMLPTHGYPELKKYEHFRGHWGGAWQKQRKEFPEFGGPILVTTNCVVQPLDSYKDRLYTTGIARVQGGKHLDNADFSEMIEQAKQIGDLPERDNGKVMTAFHHTAILGLADKIVAAVKEGKIKRFFLIGGCDGATPGRNYYTELAESIPDDCVILTLACGKYRFNDQDFGDIDGIPRLIDIGQCNNAYSAIQVAVALANVFECGVNDLPLSFVLSWFEQKAVAILLTLFHLGIKDMRLGPSLPAFVTPNVLNVLVENYNIMPIGDPKEDLEKMLQGN